MAESKNNKTGIENSAPVNRSRYDDTTMTADVDLHSHKSSLAVQVAVRDPKVPYSEMKAGDVGFEEFLIFLQSNSEFDKGDLPSRLDAEHWTENYDNNPIIAEQQVEEKTKSDDKRPLHDYARNYSTESETSLQITAEDIAALQAPLRERDELNDRRRDQTNPSRSCDELNVSYEDAVALISTIEESVKKDSQIPTENSWRNCNALIDRERREGASQADPLTLDTNDQAVNNGFFDIVWKWVMGRSCWKKIKGKHNVGTSPLATMV